MARSVVPLVLVAALAAPAFADPRLMLAGTAAAPLRLHLDAAGASVESAGGGGAPRRLALPAGGGVTGFVATRGGWLAVGSVPVTGGRELRLWTNGDETTAALPPPPQRHGAVRDFPVALLRDGDLVGLAWLEGEAADRFAVWASAWDGHRWSTPVAVSSPGAGSQLAVTGAVLADGSWLLAWSAYDGDSDEVVWSRQSKGHWTSPRPVAAGPHVPDVTPTLRPAGDGALVAWSRYDGNDYRLLLARFSGGRWAAPTWAAGPGTILPQWQGEMLTYRDAAHGAWVAASVDASDRLRPEVARAAPPEPRPALALDRDGAPQLLFQ